MDVLQQQVEDAEGTLPLPGLDVLVKLLEVVQEIAACPAELPPPTTATGSP